jgi:DNA recombination protein RmuC
VDSLLSLIHRLHWPSCLAGAAIILFPALLIGLLLHGRLSRRLFGLSIRHEQAAKNSRRLEETCARLRAERDELHHKYLAAARHGAALEHRIETEQNLASERDRLFAAFRDQLQRDFGLLSARILQEQSKTVEERHRTGLRSLLDPMQRQLEQFQNKAEEIRTAEARERAALIREIELLRGLNQRLGDEARMLSRALEGKTKIQGRWGEMVLEKLLEDSGLRPGREFLVQPALHARQGNLLRPDIIVCLPGKRDIIVDAKVSLKHWLAAVRTDDRNKERKLLDQHLKSMRAHIKGLSAKAYQALPDVNTVEYVLLFMPAEAAFQAAINHDPAILAEAARQQVILTSPSTLLAVLRLVHHLWRVDEQSKSGLAIAKQAGDIYDKFTGFIEAFEEVGFRLEQSGRSWQTARKRLVTGRGNLVDRVEALKELGVEPRRNLKQTLHGRNSSA